MAEGQTDSLIAGLTSTRPGGCIAVLFSVREHPKALLTVRLVLKLSEDRAKT